jgi:glyoxylase-like metal-dependent hydrolase (beta-lactamase superfamily II)
MLKFSRLAATAFWMAMQAAASAQTIAPAAPLVASVVKQVKPGFYMVVGNGGNAAFRVGEDGVILVDTKNPGDAEFNDLERAIREVTPLPVRYVFLTHVHNDHSGNTGRFEAAGAQVIAADGEKALLATYAPYPAGTGRSADPTTTFAKTLSVKLKGAAATALHFNPAHTSGDAVVYFPDEKAIAMGDEVVATTPNINYPDGGSALGLQKNLVEVAKLDFDTVIPGHGAEPMSRAQFEAFRAKWDLLIARARALIKAGTPKSALIAAIKTDDLGWTINPAWNAPARLDGFYAEMSR